MKKLSALIVIFISIVFTIHFSTTISDFTQKKQTCICAYDGFGYYMYLPSLFENKTLNIDKDWAQDIQDHYCNGIETYQLLKQPNGNYIDLYHIGLAYLQLPAYTISHFFAIKLGYKTDGFSLPYVVGFILNALLFCIIGLVYLRKLLLLLFDDKTAALTILLLYLSSNIFLTFTLQKDLPHLYIFALNSIFLYHLILFKKHNQKKNLIYSALFLGITVAIRPTQAMLGLTPLILLWKDSPNLKTLFYQISYYPLFGLLWNIPQIAYWFFIGGKILMPNLHVEELVIIDPNLTDFLFSYRKGWLIYSPVFILSFIGLTHLYKRNKNLFWAFFPTIIIYIYIMSSWECWWYASSFGSRVMTDIYPFLTIPIAFLWVSLSKKSHKFTFLFIGFLLSILSIFQSYQFEKGIIHHERMSKQQYFYTFGKIDKENFNEDRLLMNRKNINWIDNVENSGLYKVQKNIPIYFVNKLSFHKDTIGSRIENIVLLDKLESDETRIDVSFKIRFLSTSPNPIYLKLETCSRFNCYDWHSVEIHQDSSNKDYKEIKYRFNLPDINHKADKLQVYTINPNKVEFEIIDFKITGTTVVRD